MITWRSSLADNEGISIKTPLSGDVLPVTSHPDLLYNANVLPAALCIKLTQGKLLAPFSGVCTFSLQYNRRISINHRSGLILHIEFCAKLFAQNSKQKQLICAGNVVAGQQLMSIELPANQQNACYAVVMLSNHHSISEVWTCQRQVIAGTDPLLIIKQKNQVKE